MTFNWQPKPFWRAVPEVRAAAGVALLALVVYVLTLCRGGYPGGSAASMAVIAGLVPGTGATHPLWLLACRGAMALPVGALAVRLNGLSAVCGAGATLLLGMLVARLLAAMMPGAPENGAADPAPDRLPQSRRSVTAALGGAVAAMAFAFSAAGWSAATRLQSGSFDALLLLATGHLLLNCYRPRGRLAALGLAGLCGAGCVESVAFIVVAPLFAGFVLHAVLSRGGRRMRGLPSRLLALFLATGFGACANLLLLCHLAAADAPVAPSLAQVFAAVAHNHAAVLRGALPHLGWIWVVVLAFVPAAVAGLGGQRALQQRAVGVPMMHVFLTLANVVCLANVACSPWGQARAGGRLPVMAYLAVAGTAGYLFAYWRTLAAASGLASKRQHHRWTTTSNHWLGVVMAWVPVVTVCLAPLANLAEANGRQGELADCAARRVLAGLGERTWVVSDGVLDDNLMLAAHAQGRVLRVINLAADRDPVRLRQIRAWIDADPRFASCRTRMENAVALGAAAFVDAWLREDPTAGQALYALCAPEVWLRAGWHPLPEGCGCGGARTLEEVRSVDLLARNRAAWASLAEILAPAVSLPPSLAPLRQILRRETSRAANDLGVLLEDLGRPDEAREAYLAASRFNNQNVCALLNLLQLPAARDQAGARRNMELELRALLDAIPANTPTLALVLMHGEIRQPAVLAGIGSAWSLLGQPALAQNELERATALAPDRPNARQQVASTLALKGDTAAAERAYRAAVAGSANNTPAMIGLAAMCLCNGQTAEAHQWLDRSRQAGAPESAWGVPHAALLLADGQTNSALAYLRLFTESNPGHMEAWALEADILLRQQALDAVEQQVLPAMCKAVAPGDHVLIHVVRAHLLSRKTPVDQRALRNAFLHALRVRPDLVDVRDELLRADLQGGNRDDLPADVDETLRFDPAHALANYLSGSMLLAAGEPRRAEEHFRRSLETAASTAAFNDLAETLRRLGRHAEAEQAVRAALAREPGCGQAWDTLGRILLDTRRVGEADKAIGQALALRPQDLRIELSLARVRLAQGDPDACRRILQRPGFAAGNLPGDLRVEVETLMRSAGGGKAAASAFVTSTK